ncbi:MAG: B12-binding domain-containing radical SAM protein [Ignavibacteriaceae bacterium]|nr:B12-binding domain-containing radical SAM protein [Ignavibacteriaceae bacterium]
MKVILTHGYFLNEDPSELRIMKPYPPLGILYISAYLNEHGIENKIFDTTFSSKPQLKKFLVNEKPDIIAFYVNLMTKLNVLEIIRFIKSTHSLESSQVILGGPEVRYNASDLLKHGADFVVIGEGEETLLELIQKIIQTSNKDFKEIDGIGFKDNAGRIIFNAERNLISDINTLPYPNRNGIDLSKYQDAWKKRHGQNAISVSTMRGCPYTCKWCSRAVYGLTYRRRSPDKVVEEVQKIKEDYNPDTIWFVDDVFTISHNWLSGFNEELKKNNFKIKYECITRADRMNEDVIKTLKESGCFRVWIGAESGSQRIIDAMDRRVKVEQVREMINLSRKFGIEAGTFIMLGYPGETEKDIEETINHLKKSNPHQFTITVAYPIRGTEFFQEIETNQVNVFEWEKNTDRDRDFVRTYPRKYYEFAVRRVVNEVKFHQSKNNSLINTDVFKLKFKSIAAKAGMLWVRKSQWMKLN